MDDETRAAEERRNKRILQFIYGGLIIFGLFILPAYLTIAALNWLGSDHDTGGGGITTEQAMQTMMDQIDCKKHPKDC